MSPAKPPPRCVVVHFDKPRRTLAIGILVLALTACGAPPQSTPDPEPPQAAEPMHTQATPLRAAYETLAALPPDPELAELRASASLARLQGEVRPDDLALAGPLAELSRHERPGIRAAAVALLGQLTLAAEGRATLPPEISVALAEAMSDEEESVRLEATRSAAPLRDDAIRAALLARLADPAPQVRFQALHALHAGGDLAGDGAQRAHALPLREDPDRLVRELARTALGDD
ncbi:HEAT repeat domain-containing protein [Luteimonas saliphila]|uniref:HEAT repeat domain-containing protein n=1 Tax=Luteimonas saliphila TaxID=2804919 RepID=UPI00192D4FCB|nr:HEAT repeat domain-containing protein [Luteimonas saliphila]